MSLPQTWIHLENLKCTQFSLCTQKNVTQTAWIGSIFRHWPSTVSVLYPNTVKAGRQTQQRTWASLHADPTATESALPTRLFPSIGTRRAVKFKKEHLFLIGGAFKCSLKCPGRPFLVLFHNGLPAFLIVLQFSCDLENLRRYGISFAKRREKQGRKLKAWSAVTFLSPCTFSVLPRGVYFLQLFNRLHWTWRPRGLRSRLPGGPGRQSLKAIGSISLCDGRLQSPFVEEGSSTQFISNGSDCFLLPNSFEFIIHPECQSHHSFKDPFVFRRALGH